MATVLSRKGGGSGGSSAGVSSLEGLTGAVTLSEGSGITLTPTGNDIEIASTATGGLFDAYALLRDQRASGTNGGVATTGAYTTHVLQTESFDVGGIVSVAANQFTLQAGTYFIKGRSQHLDCDVAQIRIQNITDNTTAVTGETGYNNAGEWTGGIWLEAAGRVTIAAAKAFALQYFVSVTVGAGDLGSAASTGAVEVYASVEIWREA
jgi:hypothetical protein